LPGSGWTSPFRPQAYKSILLAKPAPEYELVLMLDPESPEDRREQIAGDARQRIEAAGSIKQDAAWGMRKMAYEIRQRTEADYRFFRFENGGSLLDELNHNLRIADGVLRFRIFKVDPASPAIEPPPPVSLAASGPPRGRREDGPPRGGDAPAPAAPAEEPAAPEEPEAPAEPAQEAPEAAEPEAGEAPAPDSGEDE
jgi:small subunit ribosomal protein S6